jgi:hypothetical protein
MVRQTQNIPATKEHLVSDEEKKQREDYHNNADATYHAGINVGQEGFYDPQAGADKHPLYEPESEPTPVLATDPGQPKGIGANLVSREQNKVLDKSEATRVSSGRKRATTEEAKSNGETEA